MMGAAHDLVIVTGVTGFVGTHLVEALRSSGLRVIGWGRDADPPGRLGALLDDYVSVDLVTTTPAVPECRAIVHLAALSAVGPSFDDPQRYITANSAMISGLGEAILVSGSRPRVLGVSTGAVYAASEAPITEDYPLGFSSPYAVSKVLGENQLAYYRSRGLDCVIARPFNHAGPGQQAGFLIPDLIAGVRDAMARGDRLRVGDLGTLRDYTDVRDVARAYTSLVLADRLEHTVYNICSGTGTAGTTVLELVEAALDAPAIPREHVGSRPTDLPKVVGDASRIRDELGWVPVIPLDQTVRDAVAGPCPGPGPAPAPAPADPQARDDRVDAAPRGSQVSTPARALVGAHLPANVRNQVPSANASARPVTIVVPLYDDIPTLTACILSIVEHGDLGRNRLLIVNDVGPRVEEVERVALGLIEGVEQAAYYRNERNLGFVETCNRAALELDQSGNDILLLNSDTRLTEGAIQELTTVLALDEKHGVVFPRSNNAAIASVPLLPLERVEADDQERARRIHARLREDLPRYSITPVAVGFCFLVRRDLIENYGFLDTVYSPGYSEENDFCLRVNKFGYSSLVAHRAFVYHEGSASFGDERVELQRRNENLMLTRYSYYRDAVIHYLQYGVEPADWFAVPLYAGERPKVLIDLYHMSLIYNGSTRNALSFLELLRERAPQIEAEFVISSSSQSIEFFDLTSYGFRVVETSKIEEVFDLGFALSPVSDPVQIRILNRHCLRWVVSHFDIIALRINSLLEVSYTRRAVVRDSLQHADRVIPISEAALDDIEAFFGAEAHGVRARSTVVHEGVPPLSFGDKTTATQEGLDPDIARLVDAGGFVLVIGNIFTHKQLPETLDALASYRNAPVIALGALPGAVPANIHFIEGGWLSDEQIDVLYRRAGVVVFPSAYEGFGLPMAEAGQRGTPVVVWDTAVAHEVAASLGIEDRTWYVDRFSKLPAVIDEARAVATTSRGDRDLRPISAYNSGILDIILDELARPVDVATVARRFAYFRSIEVYADVPERQLRLATSSALYRVFARVAPYSRPFAPVYRFARRVYRRVRAR